jgi:para-aminobenzoate synthetase component 1
MQGPLRNKGVFSVSEPAEFCRKLFTWLQGFEKACYLDSNSSPHALGYRQYNCIAGAGAISVLSARAGNAFQQLKDFHEKERDWLFGFLTYDLKNETEKLASENPDSLGFPDMMFFRPEHIVILEGNEVQVHSSGNTEDIWKEINNSVIDAGPAGKSELNISCRVSRHAYLGNVDAIRNHIIEGDVYELNYCIEFFAERADVAPAEIFSRLMQVSPMPFSAYLRTGDNYLMCASPERFMKKEGSRLVSQPIKGTCKRGTTAEEDERNRIFLRNSIKEQAENVMIVDLVRNDLARSSETGTVKVEELFGIYSFEQLHQMISTVTGQLKKDIHWTDAIKNAFPMGSMTGAPKVMAMQLIEKYELSKRGLYSGSVGYITPGGDFDLNVVIRSMLYNAGKKYLSFHVGSAITYDSKAEEEYDECLLKAAAIFEVLRPG